jgi:hypothetical protein
MATNPVDLTTLAAVQAFLDPDGQTPSWSTPQQTEQQALITQFGQWLLGQTGRRTLNRYLVFNDTYDGSGSYRQFVADYPIAQVFSIYVNGLSIPPGNYSTNGQVQPGYVIDRERESVSIIGPQYVRGIAQYGAFNVSGSTPYRIGGWSFGSRDNRNYQNVRINFSVCPNLTDAEVAQIPGSSPWQYTVANSGTFAVDLGVISQASASPFTAVLSNPGQGQYSVSNVGVYTFNEADAGTKIQIAYGWNGVPYDLQLAATEIVAVNWKRLKTIDLKSQMIGEAGTNTYRDWVVPQASQWTIDRYVRRAQVGV